MQGKPHITKAKLVTIVAASELWDRLEADLRKLGAKGYTFESVNGRGEHGLRVGTWLVRGNIRIETVVPADLGDAILRHLMAEYAGDELTAYAHEVDTIARR